MFGHALSLPSQTAPQHAALEKQLDWMFDFYRGQQDQRSWYGFWNYGDVMHTYDFDRHEWRYDVGGFAWDNSELATDVWLWMYFLRSGRADAFRFAEAMTRHTGEVDVHHLGKLRAAGLAPQRAALGLLGQTTAHQHRAEPPLLLFPDRR